MEHEVRIPDIEIIVGASGNDVAVFAFYRREDIHQGYEVVCCLAGKASSAVVGQVLQDAITTLSTTDWYTLEQLHSVDDEEVDEPPF